MASLILDAGALIAIDRAHRRVGAALHEAARTGVPVITTSACVAQAWRNPARQALLTRALAGVAEAPLDPSAARRCGELLGTTRTSDIADAAVALLAQDGDVILTSDPGDIALLVNATRRAVTVQAV